MTGEPEVRWSGQVMEPTDGLAFISRNPGDKNVYMVTGDSGNGMTHGTIAGMLVTDLIQGVKTNGPHFTILHAFPCGPRRSSRGRISMR